MTSTIFTVLFAVLLLASTIATAYLALRQIAHVMRHRHQVPVAFAQNVTQQAHEKAALYTVAKAQNGLLSLLIGSIVLLAWTLLGGLNLLNQITLEWLKPGLVQQIVLILAFSFISGIIDLPMSWYQTFVLEQKFGFNKTTLQLWLQDMLKSSLVGLIIGVPLLAVVLYFMESMGNMWWLWTWVFWMSFNALLMLIYPTFIAPLFNKFAPLDDENLKTRVAALMQRSGFSAQGFYVMDGSRRSAHANAYFTGFGSGKRVVFYDTLLKQLSVDEVEAVLAHELGHFKHKHITKRLISMGLMTLLGFYILGFVMQQAWFYTGLGVMPALDSSNNGVALLLFMLAAPVFTFMLTPIMTMMSRKDEFQADAYAASQTNGQHLVSALLKLYEDNASTLTPDPLYASIYYSHPPASQRIPKILSHSAATT
jgi:STE24 endopeptidase